MLLRWLTLLLLASIFGCASFAQQKITAYFAVYQVDENDHLFPISDTILQSIKYVDKRDSAVLDSLFFYDDNGNTIHVIEYVDGKKSKSTLINLVEQYNRITTFSRDTLGNIVAQTFFEDGSDHTLRSKIRYNSFNKPAIITMIYEVDGEGKDMGALHYEYDEQHNLISLKTFLMDELMKTERTEYAQDGKVTLEVLDDKIQGVYEELRHIYDKDGNLKEVQSFDRNRNKVSTTTYLYKNKQLQGFATRFFETDGDYLEYVWFVYESLP